MQKDHEDDRPVVSQRDVTATVKWFNPIKGFGFVQPSDGSPDAFLHVSVVQQIGQTRLPGGAVIICDIADGRRGPQVASISTIESMPEEPEGQSHGDGPIEVVEGTVKFFNAAKGFGFVIPDDGGKDVFISARTLERVGLMALEPNQRVRLQTRMGHKGPMAESLELI